MDKNKCFIIAPISTPEDRLSLYQDDVEHFEHVVEYLLAPAVEKAGFQPITPRAKSAELIHAEIVRNLQTAALVLCDMSSLNPNVMFELGIRTAMNMPVCLIIDDATPKAPFDLAVINHHKYNPDLREWVLRSEIDKLAEHIRTSASATDNSLWKYFALHVTAQAAEVKSGEQSELALLRMEIEGLRSDVNRSDEFIGDPGFVTRPNRAAVIQNTAKRLSRIAAGLGINSGTIKPTMHGDVLEYWLEIPANEPAHPKLGDLKSIANAMGIKMEIEAVVDFPVAKRGS